MIRLFAVMSALVLLATALMLWHWSAPQPAEASYARTVTAKAGPMRVHAIGYIDLPDEMRELSFEAEGRIAEVLVEEGERVETGQLLMRLDATVPEARMSAAEAEVMLKQAERDRLVAGAHRDAIAQAAALVEARRANVEHAQLELERLTAIHAANAATGREMQTHETRLRQAEAELLAAEAEHRRLLELVRPEDVAHADAGIDVARQQLLLACAERERYDLRAPMEGTVLRILKQGGERVTAFDTLPALVVGDLSRPVVRAEVDERFAAMVRPGQTATISGPNLGGESYAATVRHVRPLMGTKTLFSDDPTQRKDIGVVEVILDMPRVAAPLGLRVEVAIELE